MLVFYSKLFLDNITMGVLTMFLLLSAAFSLGDACFRPHRCNRGWHQFGSRCFRFEETLRSWTEAERHCQSLGGHLASVHSWKESRFLKMLTVGSPLTWIGGNDGGRPELTKDRSWSWTDGSGFNYHEWAQGEPNNYNGVREPCIQMNFGEKHRWNDDVCEKRFASVCSRSR
ncbi:ladderlectin-like isoform X2 [Esox lucius]|uniref:ladderlectin-like isoform X2 n=1 Tax=Esox lucius TaxID=8010 RepID=UPI001476B911|nr:ladderlectin-like isoform X2 [Esox lucius]